MSAAIAPSQQGGVRGSALGRALAAELAKIATLRGWWIGVGALLALAVAFAAMNTSLIVEQVGALAPDATFKDSDGTPTTVRRAVLNGVLAPTYQSAAFFLPVLIALAVGQEYRRRQILVSATAVPSRAVLFTAKLIAVVIASAALCLVSCALGDVVLLVMLTARLDAVVLSPALNQALPIIGAQSFLFGYVVEPGAPGQGAGLMILLAWALVPAIAWASTFTRRDLARARRRHGPTRTPAAPARSDAPYAVNW